ncbi:MAG: protease complex subunit PrcB family protein [Lachnospiraceae bacterium]
MRKFWACLTTLCVLGMMAGCSVEKINADKLRDLEFTVVKKEEVPEELKVVIEREKKEPFKFSYADQGYLYIARGYGAKETSGYSIEVKECYEAENAVYIQTNLLGPARKEVIVEKTTYPYAVVKLEMIEKTVMFK